MTGKERDRKRDFEEIALPYLNSIYRAALYMARSTQKAEDLAQETYLRAYKAFDSFEKGSNCKAWLFKILKNTFINMYRKDVKSPATLQYEEIENFYLYDKMASNQSTDIDLSKEPERIKEFIGEEVNAALESLPDEFKETVILSDIEGFTYEEISGITGLPIGTVKSRLYRARKQLQKNLWDYAVKRGLIKNKKEGADTL